MTAQHGGNVSDKIDDHDGDCSGKPSGRQAFLRFFKLQILDYLSWRRASSERRKIAIYKNRPLAILQFMLHVVPLSAAIALIALNWTRYFIALEFSSASALQFAAKLHEVLMQASLADIAFAIVRVQLTDGHLPLGAVMAPIQTTQLSYLWSLELWSAITSNAWKRWYRIMFVTLIPCIIALASLVGPSSAVTMIPRPMVSKSSEYGSVWFEVSDEELFPAIVGQASDQSPSNITNSTQLRLPKYDSEFYTQFNRINSGPEKYVQIFEPNSVPRILRTLTLENKTFIQSFSAGTSRSVISGVVSTLPSRFAAVGVDSVSHLHSDDYSGESLDHRILSTLYYQPAIVARCHWDYVEANKSALADTPLYYFSEDPKAIQTTTFRNVNVSDDTLTQALNDTLVEDQDVVRTAAYWLPTPEKGSTSLIATFWHWDNSSYSPIVYPRPGFDTFTINYCTISAFWHRTRYEWSVQTGTPVVQTDRFTENDLSSGILSKISLSLDWTKNCTENSTADTDFYQSLGQSNGNPLLAAVIAKQLSEIQSVAVGCGWGVTGGEVRCGEVENRVRIRAVLSGYGYSNASTTVKLSLVVLIIYCITVFMYLIYLLVTGMASTAWNSAVEFLILALQSDCPKHLGRSTVGVEKMATFREPVGVREAQKDDGVQLVFANDRDSEAILKRKVVPNKAY